MSDYVAGKYDWVGMGLPTEGRLAAQPRLKDLARVVPTCGLGESVGEVAERAKSTEWDIAVALNDRGVVLGLLGRQALRGEGSRHVQEAMTPGPSTYRPSVSVVEMREHVRDRPGLNVVIVTRSDGTLLGAFRRDELG